MQRVICDQCSSSPVISNKSLDFISKYGGRLFEPTPSKEIKDSYMTFIEMKETTEVKDLASGDKYLPSLIAEKSRIESATAEIIRCPICPAWSFTSKTERLRHMKVLHRSHKAAAVRKGKPAIFRCNYEGCTKSFTSPYYLSLHRKKKGHLKRKATSSRSKIADKAKKSKMSITDHFKAASVKNCDEVSAESATS